VLPPWVESDIRLPSVTPTIVPPAVTPPTVTLPSARIAHGAFPGDLFAGMLTSQARAVIQGWERLTGKELAVVHLFTTVDAFPDVALDVIAEHGATPMISLSPGQHSLDAIIQGVDDGDYRRFAAQLRDWTQRRDRQVLLRWGWEMNGYHPWSGVRNGNGPEAPRRYIEAWRHVVGLFRAQGATADRVPFVWCPDAYGQGQYIGTPDKWNYTENYYPGDDWVDWVGLDGYCGPKNSGHSFEDIFDSPTNGMAMSTMARAHPQKPMLLGEIAVSNGGDTRWLYKAFEAMTSDRYPTLRLICWFNKDQDGYDWQLRPGTEVTNAYRQLIGSERILTILPQP
jgi:hypothetical protein